MWSLVTWKESDLARSGDMSRISRSMSLESNLKILRWELAAVFFILLFGSGLHFVFEFSNFWHPVAPFAAVNESIWERLKMVFWPGLIFFSVQYAFFKTDACAEQFWTAKALCLVLMSFVSLHPQFARTRYHTSPQYLTRCS